MFGVIADVIALWLGTDGKAISEDVWSQQVGMSSFAFCGKRLLPMQFRRLFITYAYPILLSLGIGETDAVDMLADICRTSREHIMRNYRLDNRALVRRDTINTLLDNGLMAPLTQALEPADSANASFVDVDVDDAPPASLSVELDPVEAARERAVRISIMTLVFFLFPSLLETFLTEIFYT